MMLESVFQKKLIEKIEREFPGAVVLKNDPNYIQGIPDLSVYFKEYWAMLETKKSFREPFRPNQLYYLDMFDQMSFARAVYPENLNEVIDELQRTFAS